MSDRTPSYATHATSAHAPKVPLWSVTIWDKKFNSVAPGKQKTAIKYHYLLAGDLKEKIVPGGDIKLLTTSETDWWTTEDKVAGLVSEGEIVSIPWGGNPNVQYFNGKFVTADNRIATSLDKGILDNKFLYYFMLSKRNTIGSFYRGAGLKHPEMAKVLDMEIPLPSIEVQRSLVCSMDKVAKVISARKAQLESLSQLVKSRFVEMFGDPMNNSKKWERVRFDSICENLDGRRIPITSSDRKQGQYPYYGASGIVDYVDDYIFDEDILLVSEDGANLKMRSSPIAFSVEGKCWVNNHAHVVRFKERATQKYVEHHIELSNIEGLLTGSTQPKLNQAKLNGMLIMVPPLALQREFAAFVAKVDKLAFAVRKSLEMAEKLYRQQLSEVFS